MLSNSVVAAALATSYVVILVLQLNPRLSSGESDILALVRTVGPVYVAHLTVLFYAALVVCQIFARELFSPAWVSLGVLTWLGALAAAVGAALMWANAGIFALVITADTARTMALGARVLAIAALLFLAIAVARHSLHPRWRIACAVAWLGIAIGSVVVPVSIRGEGLRPPAQPPLGSAIEPPVQPRTSRVTIFALDAGSLDFVTRATAEGRLPNFGRILDRGAAMHLATLRPASAEAVWTAVATGKLPQKNNVRSASVYRQTAGGEDLRLLPDFCYASSLVRFGFLTELPHDASILRSRTLWSLLTASGVSVAVINWPLTAPVEPVIGYVVSDQYARHALTPAELENPSLVYPPDLHDALLPVLRAAGEREPPLSIEALSLIPERFRAGARMDAVHDDIAQFLSSRFSTQVTIARYESLDPIGHYFLRYADPVAFGNVTADERRQFGMTLESQYAVIDDAIGRAIEALGPEDVLFVVSGYGMEPLGFGKRMLERLIGDPHVNGTHEAAPDGFLLAYGGPIAPARHVTRGSVVDVVPTVLYALGLPVGRDMDGAALTSIFEASFTDENAITVIPTYDR